MGFSMVFESYKRKPLFSKFNSPFLFKASSDDFCGVIDVISQCDSKDDHRCAYNFDHIQVKPKRNVEKPQNMLPIPIPAIEPVPTSDLEETCEIHFKCKSLEYSPRSLYQWHRPDDFLNSKSQEMCVGGVGILNSIISFESRSFNSYNAFDSEDGTKQDSDERSLLLDQSLSRSSNLFTVKSFASKKHRKVCRFTPDESADGDHIYLMKEVHNINDCCFQRQLAFDLDSIEDSKQADFSLLRPNLLEPQWVLEPDDIKLENPPPVPGINSKKYYPESRLYCDEDFMDTDDEAELFSSILHRNCHPEFSCIAEACDQYDSLNAERGVGSSANLIQKDSSINMFAYGRLRRRSKRRKTKRNYSRSARYGRKLGSQRSPLEDRIFSPNLSTVTEKPSEEDASCLPTPRSCMEHQCTERELFDVVLQKSEEDTTETCNSSNDSDM